VQVCCLFYFLLSRFFKGKAKSGFFTVFFDCLFFKRKWLWIRLAWRNSNKRVGLSFKRRGSSGVAVLRYSWYANGFRFDSHLADLTFFFLYFFSGLRVTFTD